jgi:alpha-tubulin suppressor-like RCC1 family protein
MHSCAARANGTAACWGAGGEGELGNGDWSGIPHSSGADPALVTLFPVTPAPVAVSGLSDVLSVAAGWASTFAIRSTGAVAAWGSSYHGQLGYGGRGFVPSPVAVAGFTGAVSIAGGARHTCAVRDSGEVDCWGWDGYGQLGNATSDNYYYSEFPAAVLGLFDGVSVAAGQDHTCALRASGEVACWGHNSYGELGDGTTNDSAVPVLVSGLSDAVGIGAGGEQTCAVRATGQVVCWGRGDTGELGNGTVPFSPTPTPVTVLGLSDALAVSVGEMHTCALRANGQVACWGQGGSGELGDGVVTRPNGLTWIPQPVTVSGLSDAVAVTAGFLHTCAVRRGGQAVCWGWGGDGQVGDGGLWMSNVPVPVLGFGDNTGQVCAAAADCTSGFCVDGVCCAGACGGGDPNDCQACAVAAGAVTDGTCGARASGTICRAVVGTCDVAESCDGTGLACPVDRFVSAGQGCRASAGVCDVAEACTGSSATCPVDRFAPSLTTCRPKAGGCDVAETCTGSSVSCPADGLSPAGTVCAPPATACETAGLCGGASPICPGATSIPGCSASPVSACSSGSCSDVTLRGGIGVENGINLTFEGGVTSAGTVSVASCTAASAPPTGYKIVVVATSQYCWDLATTAHYESPITVCIHYPNSIAANEGGFQMVHDDGTGYALITASLDTASNIICGTASSLSPFAIVEPLDSTPPVFSNVPGPITAFATATTGAKVTYTLPKAVDGVDGARPVTCAPASGAQFPLGKTSVTCTASDKHHNTSTAKFTVWVQVQAATDGTFFLAPIRPNGSSIFRVGRPVPVRFKLTGASANITNLTAKLVVTKISSSVQGTTEDASDETVADTDFVFQYRPALKWYAYRWKTTDQTQGTYQLKADLGDGVVHQINVSLRAAK